MSIVVTLSSYTMARFRHSYLRLIFFAGDATRENSAYTMPNHGVNNSNISNSGITEHSDMVLLSFEFQFVNGILLYRNSPSRIIRLICCVSCQDDWNDAVRQQLAEAQRVALEDVVVAVHEEDPSIWTNDRATFFKMHQGMSSHSTMALDDPRRRDAHRKLLKLPPKPTFLDSRSSSSCCAIERDSRCKRCPIICGKCKNGDSDSVVTLCDWCPLAVPAALDSCDCVDSTVRKTYVYFCQCFFIICGNITSFFLPSDRDITRTLSNGHGNNTSSSLHTVDTFDVSQRVFATTRSVN